MSQFEHVLCTCINCSQPLLGISVLYTFEIFISFCKVVCILELIAVKSENQGYRTLNFLWQAFLHSHVRFLLGTVPFGGSNVVCHKRSPLAPLELLELKTVWTLDIELSEH